MRYFVFSALITSLVAWAGPRPVAPVSLQPDLVFEPNVGQTDAPVRFWGHAPGAGLWLTDSGAVISFEKTSKNASKGAALGMHFEGARLHPAIEAVDPRPGRSSYFIGNDSSQWRTGIRQFGRVRYHDVYPGIDVMFYGTSRRLEYDWIVAPGADPSAIRMSFRGQDSMKIGPSGDLVLSLGDIEIVEHNPSIYQETNGQRRKVDGHFVRHGRNSVGFEVARYDSTRALTIDPAVSSSAITLTYSSFLGGGYVDGAEAVAVDLQGRVFVGGATLSANFPAKLGLYGTGVNSAQGLSNGFIAKFDTSQVGGPSLIWATYFGGGGAQVAQTFILGVATDVQGNVYFTGDTASPVMPTVNPFQSTIQQGTCPDNPDFTGADRCTDAFVAKLSGAGDKLLYSSYLGGAGTDYGAAITVDVTGTAWIAGSTRSNNLAATSNAFQPALRGIENGFLAQISPDGGTLQYLSYAGGQGIDLITSMAADNAGNVYIAGTSTSVDLPVRNTVQGGTVVQASRAGATDGFVMKINPALQPFQQIVYCTYLGGSTGSSIFHGIVVDSTGKIYLTGATTASDFPVTPATAFQSTYTAKPQNFTQQFNAVIPGLSYIYGNAVVTELDPSIAAGPAQLIYSTYLGGSTMEIAQSLAFDKIGRLLVAGQTASIDFPITSATAYQTSNNAQGYYPFTGFLSLLDPTQRGPAGLVFSTYFGGSEADIPTAVTVDPTGGVILTGVTVSPDYKTVNAYQPSYNGPTESFLNPVPGDAFIARFDFSGVGGQQVSTLAHVADGNGFRTEVLLVNTGTAAAPYSLQFFDQAGNPVTYPLGSGEAMSGTIAAGAEQLVQTTGQGSTTNLGWGQLTAPSIVKGTLIFQQQASPTSLQEGTAPIVAPSTHFFVPYDNTGGDVTSFGVANPSSTQSTNVIFTLHVEAGGNAALTPIALGPRQQVAEPLTTLSSDSAGSRGMIEVTSTAPVSLVAFRFQGSAFTLFDTLPPVPSGTTTITSTIAHVADGDNFRTTIVLANSGTADAPYTLNIFDMQGHPQSFGLDATSSLTGTVKAGSTRTINTTGLGAVTNLGWAQLIAPPAVGGIAIFRQTNPGQNEQQATVPITQYSLEHFFVPFDNVGNTTSIALANPDPATTALINVTFRYTDGSSGAGLMNLGPQHYTAQTLAELFSQVAGKAGVAEFTANVPIAIVEVRFNPTQAFTSLRSVAP